jgi:uncharacterized protein
MEKIFLTARWEKLLMANYEVDAALLLPHLPAGTELDRWNGKCLVSLVGFMFLDTRVLGIPIPFHRNFEEVNLRFYVRYKAAEGWRRGVVFIKEIVPLPAITWTANLLYQEHYQWMPMRHAITRTDCLQVKYEWKHRGVWNSIAAKASAAAQPMIAGSEAEFILEHYWGYSRVSAVKTREYAVGHPRWEIYDVLECDVHCSFGTLYGSEFSFLENAAPVSVFLAEGSEIVVRKGRVVGDSW